MARSSFVGPYKTSTLTVHVHLVKVISVRVNSLAEPVQICICSLPGTNSSMCCLLWFVSLNTILSQIWRSSWTMIPRKTFLKTSNTFRWGVAVVFFFLRSWSRTQCLTLIYLKTKFSSSWPNWIKVVQPFSSLHWKWGRERFFASWKCFWTLERPSTFVMVRNKSWAILLSFRSIMLHWYKRLMGITKTIVWFNRVSKLEPACY